MKIAIDIDGVLADTMPVLNNFYNQRAGTNFMVADYRYHDLEKTWGGAREDAVRVIKDFYQSRDFLRITPVPNSQEGVSALSKNHRLFSITTRPESVSSVTKEFIKKNFGGQIRKAVHIGQHSFPSSHIDKFSACSSEKAEVLIEDCLEVAINCANKGIRVFLLNQPWNRLNGQSPQSMPGNLSRVKDWKELLQHLE